LFIKAKIEEAAVEASYDKKPEVKE